MLGSSKCFLQAAEAFEFARSQLEKFEGVGSLDCEAAAIALICKRNAVVARILSSGNKIDVGFRSEFVFYKSAGNDIRRRGRVIMIRGGRVTLCRWG